MSKPKHVGTWVFACDENCEFTKWGVDGDTVYPYPPDEVEAFEQAKFLLNNPGIGQLYILRVFDNGQMKQFTFDETSVAGQNKEQPYVVEVRRNVSQKIHVSKEDLKKYICYAQVMSDEEGDCIGAYFPNGQTMGFAFSVPVLDATQYKAMSTNELIAFVSDNIPDHVGLWPVVYK